MTTKSCNCSFIHPKQLSAVFSYHQQTAFSCSKLSSISCCLLHSATTQSCCKLHLAVPQSCFLLFSTIPTTCCQLYSAVNHKLAALRFIQLSFKAALNCSLFSYHQQSALSSFQLSPKNYQQMHCIQLSPICCIQLSHNSFFQLSTKSCCQLYSARTHKLLSSASSCHPKVAFRCIQLSPISIFQLHPSVTHQLLSAAFIPIRHPKLLLDALSPLSPISCTQLSHASCFQLSMISCALWHSAATMPLRQRAYVMTQMKCLLFRFN